MKLITGLLLCISTLSLALFIQEKVAINIRVMSDYLPLKNVWVEVVDHQGNPVITQQTNTRGKLNLSVDQGVYTIIARKPGYTSDTLKNVSALNEEVNLQITLFPIDEDDAMYEYRDIEMEDISPRIEGFDISSGILKDMAGDKPASAKMMTSSYAPSSVITSVSKARLPGSGQVTAGEWNDLNNWKAWTDLQENADYRKYQDAWNIYPKSRYSVNVTTIGNQPYYGAEVQLVNVRGEIIWSTKTDVAGRAELWNNPFGSADEISHIEIITEEKVVRIQQPISIEDGSNVKSIDIPCAEENGTDIAFVVDATSSMSDEILYLQSELSDVIKRVKTEVEDLQLASVFYRDHQDAYVTRKHDFTRHIDEIAKFLQEQEADGGGDFPEAVSDALEVAVNSLSWRPASNKLLFLLLDAPPHLDQEYLTRYRAIVKKAASKGIRLIPISASGINRDTEFLLKYTSMLTNGTYVFITDDSGIGDQHLDPVVKDYEVEKLNDLLVRLIKNYAYFRECQPIEDALNTELSFRLYPNPATSFINIEGAVTGDQIQLIATTGKVILREIIDQDDLYQLKLQDIVPGNYLLSIVRGDHRITKSILILI